MPILRFSSWTEKVTSRAEPKIFQLEPARLGLITRATATSYALGTQCEECPLSKIIGVWGRWLLLVQPGGEMRFEGAFLLSNMNFRFDEIHLIICTVMLRKLMKYLVKILGHTAKGIWDTSIISSIKPKSDYQFFGDLHVLYTLWTQNFSASSANQNKNNSKFANLEKHMNCQKII